MSVFCIPSTTPATYQAGKERVYESRANLAVPGVSQEQALRFKFPKGLCIFFDMIEFSKLNYGEERYTCSTSCLRNHLH